MRMGYTVGLLLGMSLCLSGCLTPMMERQEEDARRQSEMEKLKADVYRLSERLNGVAAAQERLQADMQEFRKAAQGGNLQDRLAKIENDQKRSEAALASMRQDLVESLSKKMAQIMRVQAAATPAAETGREHVVKPGESLSKIAAAYGVKPEAIVKANGLKNTHALRDGQKLFIPE